jgi:hypothetical protein
MFITGLSLIVYEAVIRTGPERIQLLLLYAGMIGLPAFMRADEKRSPKSDESSNQEVTG